MTMAEIAGEETTIPTRVREWESLKG